MKNKLELRRVDYQIIKVMFSDFGIKPKDLGEVKCDIATSVTSPESWHQSPDVTQLQHA